MDVIYRKAGMEDIDILTAARVQVLRAANRLADGADMSGVEKASRESYQECFGNDSHAAFLIFDGKTFVGAGGVSFYSVMPPITILPAGRRIS